MNEFEEGELRELFADFHIVLLEPRFFRSTFFFMLQKQ